MPIILPSDPPPTPAPDPGPLTDAADKVYNRLAPYHAVDTANGDILRHIVDALTHPTATVFDVSRQTLATPAWGKALDPDETPAEWLPWLAQIPGVKLLPGDTEAQQRLRIKAAAGFYRGTTRAIIEEVQAYLTGTRQVYVVAPVGDHEWTLEVGTLTTETPFASDADNAVARQTPAWVLGSFGTQPALSLLAWMATVAAHRETIDGIDTYVDDSVDVTLTAWLAEGGTLTDWLAGD